MVRHVKGLRLAVLAVLASSFALPVLATEPEGIDTTAIVATITGAVAPITAVAVAVITLVVAVKVYKYIKSAL